MKLFELFQLLEYNRDITKQKLGDKLVHRNKTEGNRGIFDDIIADIEWMDPTKNKQYVEWICRQYINAQFRMEDMERILDVLIRFENIKSRLPQNERDINKYTFHQLEDKMDEIHNPKLSDENGIPTGN